MYPIQRKKKSASLKSGWNSDTTLYCIRYGVAGSNADKTSTLLPKHILCRSHRLCKKRGCSSGQWEYRKRRMHLFTTSVTISYAAKIFYSAARVCVTCYISQIQTTISRANQQVFLRIHLDLYLKTPTCTFIRTAQWAITYFDEAWNLNCANSKKIPHCAVLIWRPIQPQFPSLWFICFSHETNVYRFVRNFQEIKSLLCNYLWNEIPAEMTTFLLLPFLYAICIFTTAGELMSQNQECHRQFQAPFPWTFFASFQCKNLSIIIIFHRVIYVVNFICQVLCCKNSFLISTWIGLLLGNVHLFLYCKICKIWHWKNECTKLSSPIWKNEIALLLFRETEMD